MWKMYIDEETGESYWEWEEDGSEYVDEGSSADYSPTPTRPAGPEPAPDFQGMYESGGLNPDLYEMMMGKYSGHSPVDTRTASERWGPKYDQLVNPEKIPYIHGRDSAFYQPPPSFYQSEEGEFVPPENPLIEGYGQKIAIKIPGKQATDEWGTPMTDEYVKDIEDTLALTDEEIERKIPKKEISGFAKLIEERKAAMPEIERQAERYAFDASGGRMDRTYYAARQKAIDEGIKQHDNFVYKREEAKRADEAAAKLAAYKERTDKAAAAKAESDAIKAAEKDRRDDEKQTRELNKEERKSDLLALDKSFKDDMEELDNKIKDAEEEDKDFLKAQKIARMAAYKKKRKAIIRGEEFVGSEETAPAAPTAPAIRPTPVRTAPKGPPPGFKRAPDGNYYGPDPNRPGKYLRWKG